MTMSPDMYVGMMDMGQLQQMLTAFAGVAVAISLISSIYSLIVYILQSVGLYSVAKRRGIYHAWLSWIPLGNLWILGSISDQYQYLVKNKIQNRRKSLLWMSIISVLLTMGSIVWLLVFSVQFALAGGVQNTPPAQVYGIGAVVLLVSFVVGVLHIVWTVMLYISYYSLFASSRPGAAVAFEILGIIFPFLLPYFIFACRNKDDGMPPREAPAEPEILQYMPESEGLTTEIGQTSYLSESDSE